MNCATNRLAGRSNTSIGAAICAGLMAARALVADGELLLDAYGVLDLATNNASEWINGLSLETGRLFSSTVNTGNGTLTVIKENSPTSFEVEQTVSTMPTAKTLTLDTKTNHILLIAAEFAPAPADAPAGQPGRADELLREPEQEGAGR